MGDEFKIGAIAKKFINFSNQTRVFHDTQLNGSDAEEKR